MRLLSTALPTPAQGTYMFKPRLRFSLLSFVLVVSLICVSVSHLHVTFENQRVETENLALKEDLGYLIISDPTKAYVRQVESMERGTWRFRVYLPPKSTYTFNCRIDGHGSGAGPLKATNQFTLLFSLRENRTNGKWEAFGAWAESGMQRGGWSLQLGEKMPEKLNDLLLGDAATSRRHQREFQPDGEIDLLQMGDDFHIWIAPQGRPGA